MTSKKSFYKKKWLVWLIFGVVIFVTGNWSGWNINKKWVKNGCDESSFSQPIRLNTEQDVLSLVVVGDAGQANSNSVQIAAQVKQFCQSNSCDFGLLLGDNFYENGVTKLNDPLFEQVFADLWNQTDLVFYPVLGNHDIKGDVRSQVDYSLLNDHWHMPDYAYSLNSKHANFFAINTNCHIFGLQNLKAALTRVTNHQSWNIVFGHHPVYGLGSHASHDLAFRSYWNQAIAESVDLYLAGHIHALEFLKEQPGKTLYAVSGSGSKLFDDPNKESVKSQIAQWNEAGHFVAIEPGFLWLEIRPDRLFFQFISQDGKVLYQKEKTR